MSATETQTSDASREKTVIWTDNGDLARQANEAWAALLEHNEGSVPASLVESSRSPSYTQVNALRDALSRSVQFCRTNEAGNPVPTYPPREVAEALLARPRVSQAIGAGAMSLPKDEDGSLAALFEKDLPDQEFVVEGLLGVGHNGTLAGPFKAGKTSMACDLTRCLVDGEPFLGCFDTRLEGSVGWFSAEMAERDFRTYMAALRFRNATRAYAWHLRGHRLPLMDDAAAERAVCWLRDREVGFWIVDSHARLCAWSRVSENSNDDVAALLARMDEIKAEAGVRELLHICHFGRAVEAQHARGATVLDDWPDARWVQTKDDAGNRFLAVEGRGVELALSHVERGDDHRLRRTDMSPSQVRRSGLVDDVVRLVSERPGINKGDLTAAMSGGTKDKADAVSQAATLDLIWVEPVGTSQRHWPGARPR